MKWVLRTAVCAAFLLLCVGKGIAQEFGVSGGFYSSGGTSVGSTDFGAGSPREATGSCESGVDFMSHPVDLPSDAGDIPNPTQLKEEPDNTQELNDAIEAWNNDEVADRPAEEAVTVFRENVVSNEEFESLTVKERWDILRELMIQEQPGENNVEIRATPSAGLERVRELLKGMTPVELRNLYDTVVAREHWPRRQPSGPPVEIRQVRPGTPVGGDGIDGVNCTDGRSCGSPRPYAIPVHERSEVDDRSGRAQITYSRNAHQFVVELSSPPTTVDGNGRACTATMIANVWGITALHCLAVDGTELRREFAFTPIEDTGWSKLRPIGESQFAIVSESGAYLVEYFYVPYNEDDGKILARGEVPEKDIALVQLNSEMDMTGFSVMYPEFASESDVRKRTAVTFVGYGWTDVGDDSENPGKLAAFNWLDEATKVMVTWTIGDRGGNGGPCRGDSGGPILMGWLRGFADDRRELAGVVSALRATDVSDEDACLHKVGEGEPVHPYVQEICAITHGSPVGCGP